MTETIEEKIGIWDKITDNIIAIIVTIAIMVMLGYGITIPDWLVAAYSMILTFYFKP